VWCDFSSGPTSGSGPVYMAGHRAHEALTTGKSCSMPASPCRAAPTLPSWRAFVESVRYGGRSALAESCWRGLGVDPVVMRSQLAVPLSAASVLASAHSGTGRASPKAVAMRFWNRANGFRSQARPCSSRAGTAAPMWNRCGGVRAQDPPRRAFADQGRAPRPWVRGKSPVPGLTAT